MLVAEDDESIRFVVTLLLARHGCRVIACDGPAEALASWQSRRDDIDVLLTDIRMPGMTGRELAARIATEDPGLPVVYMSGYEAPTAADGPDAPPGPFLQKPFTEPQLVAAIASALTAH